MRFVGSTRNRLDRQLGVVPISVPRMGKKVEFQASSQVTSVGDCSPAQILCRSSGRHAPLINFVAIPRRRQSSGHAAPDRRLPDLSLRSRESRDHQKHSSTFDDERRHDTKKSPALSHQTRPRPRDTGRRPRALRVVQREIRRILYPVIKIGHAFVCLIASEGSYFL